MLSGTGGVEGRVTKRGVNYRWLDRRFILFSTVESTTRAACGTPSSVVFVLMT